MPLLKQKTLPMLFFDTETTGLTLHPDADPLRQPRVIEFGAMLLNPANGETLREVSWLVNPGEALTPEITKITGLTDADLKDAPRFAEVLPELRDLFAGCGSMWAHNLPFDRAIISGELRRLSVDGFAWPPAWFCTVGLYAPEWGRNPKLLELYERVLGKPLAQTHRALDDVRAMVEIARAEKLWELL